MNTIETKKTDQEVTACCTAEEKSECCALEAKEACCGAVDDEEAPALRTTCGCR